MHPVHQAPSASGLPNYQQTAKFFRSVIYFTRRSGLREGGLSDHGDHCIECEYSVPPKTVAIAVGAVEAPN